MSKSEVQAAKAQASYGRMRADLLDRWIDDAKNDPSFLASLVITAVNRLSDEEAAQFWRHYNNMEMQDE